MQQQLLTAAKRSCILRIHITMVDDVRFKGSLPCKSSLWIGIARPFGTLVIATKSSISRLVIGYHWWYLRFWVTRSVTVHAKEIGTSRFIYAKKSLNSSTSIKLKNDLVSWIFITITFGGMQTRVFVDLIMVRIILFFWNLFRKWVYKLLFLLANLLVQITICDYLCTIVLGLLHFFPNCKRKACKIFS